MNPEAKHLSQKTYPVETVETRKHVLVSQSSLGQNTSFDFNIGNVDFTPDEMIVRSICYTQTAGNNTGWAVYTDLVGGYLGAFMSGQPNNLAVTFKVRKPINGTYNFKIFDRATTNNNLLINAPDNTGNLFISLEFIKYGGK